MFDVLFATCRSRIRHQAAAGSWTMPRQWEIQRTWLNSARAAVRSPGVAPPQAPRVPRSRAASYLWPVRPYAVPRRTRRRGEAGRGAAAPAVWGRRRAGTACACCARYSTSWSPASSSSCSLMML